VKSAILVFNAFELAPGNPIFSAFPWHAWFQNFSSVSLEVLRNCTLPTRGKSTGAVITSLPADIETRHRRELLARWSGTTVHLLGGKRRGETCRARADDQHIERPRPLHASLAIASSAC